jgi:hypothetical protein
VSILLYSEAKGLIFILAFFFGICLIIHVILTWFVCWQGSNGILDEEIGTSEVCFRVSTNAMY